MTAPKRKSGWSELVRRDGVGSVWCEGREILQRIFVTVRDKNWKEVAPTHWQSEIDEARGIARLTARHESGSVGFEWRGTLHASEDRRQMRFEMLGRVFRDMEVCRLGLVVLHPVESMVGSQVGVAGPESTHRITVGEIIAPQPVVNGMPLAMTEPFSKLTVERPDFGKLELEFEGELFELEDQRNWGDASFKTYCTPLRLGFPRKMKAGTAIRHCVEVRFVPGGRAKAAPVRDLSGTFPRIGCEWNRPGVVGVRHSPDRYDPAWDHLHCDVGALESVTELAELLAADTSPRLQIAFEARDNGPPREAIELLLAHCQRIARLLIYGPRASLPSVAAVERWRGELEMAGADRDIAVLAATKGYFVEFNRGVAFDAPVAGIAFPLTATVHSDDTEMIGENVGAIREMAGTARNRTGAAEIAVAPLALYYPRPTTPQQFPAGLAAPWLAATLIHAGLRGVQSVTLANDVIESMGTGAKANIAGFVLRLVGCTGRKIQALQGGFGLPKSLHAVVFTSAAPGEPRALVANVCSRTLTFSLPGMGGETLTATNAVAGETSVLQGGDVEIPGFGVILVG